MGRNAQTVRVERKVAIPVVCCTVLLGVVATCFPLLVLPHQFERWEHHLGLQSFGSGILLFRHLYRGGPILPVLLLGVGAGQRFSLEGQPGHPGDLQTFRTSPKEFAFSNNGITLLCERQLYDPGQKVLTLENPRVVNGSQTLHSIRDVPNPSPNARVMVRVIEIEPPRGDAFDEKIQRRKEIIGKIAVRSNQQNPIKSWDLASNDDFQLELFRYFRGKGFFYERRNGEWQQRSRELRSVGIQYGTSIRWHTQLIASFHWAKPHLGPAAAKNVADLFEGALYEMIRETPAELAFQIYLFCSNLEECRRDLLTSKVYIRNLKWYEFFALVSVAVRASARVGARWGDPEFTKTLRNQWDDFYPIPARQPDLSACCRYPLGTANTRNTD